MHWIIAQFLGTLPYFPAFGIFNSNGFCSISTTSIVFRGSAVISVLFELIYLCIILICCILTFVYMKKNTLEDNVDVKKAIVKVLVYLFVNSILTFINSAIPIANPAIRAALEERSVAGLIAVDYFLRVFLNIPSIVFPIIAIALLKPVRIAMKQMSMKVFCACRVSVDETRQTGEVVPAIEMTAVHVKNHPIGTSYSKLLKG